LFPLMIGELPPGLTEFALEGQLLLRLRGTLRAETTLTAGASVSAALALGATTLTLSATAGEGDVPGRVMVSYLSGGLEDLAVTVRSGDGTPLGRGGKSSTGVNRRQEDTWPMAGLAAGQAYTVVVTAYEPLAQPALPLGVAVSLR